MLTPAKLLKTWLDNQIETIDPGTQIPTDGVLAKNFKISISSVKRIVNPFVKAGKLTRVQGKGTFKSGIDVNIKPIIIPNPSSADNIVDSLYQSICNG